MSAIFKCKHSVLLASLTLLFKNGVRQGLMIDQVIGAQREACMGGNGLDHKNMAEGACNGPVKKSA